MGIDEVVSGSSSTRVYRAIDECIRRKKKSMTSDILAKFEADDPDEFQQAATSFDTATGSEHYDFIATIVQNHREGKYQQDRGLLKAHRNELRDLVRTHVDGLITYHGIGIQDNKMEDRGRKRNKEYLAIVESGGITPVDVGTIVTMDQPGLCPARYRPLKEPGRYVQDTPMIQDFPVTAQYVELLQGIAKISGKNPGNVAPVNFTRMLDSSRYLGPQYQAA